MHRLLSWQTEVLLVSEGLWVKVNKGESFDNAYTHRPDGQEVTFTHIAR